MNLENRRSHSERKEDVIFEALSRKVHLVRDFMLEALAIPGGDVPEQLDALRERLLRSVPSEDLAAYVAYKELDEEIVASDPKVRGADQARLSQDDEDLKWREWLALKERRDSLLSGSEGYGAIFLKSIDDLVLNLKRKHAEVQELISQRSPDEVKRACLALLMEKGERIAESDIISVRQDDPYTLVLSVWRTGFDAMFGEMGERRNRGAFIKDTPLCLVLTEDVDFDSTALHERIHALSDSVLILDEPAGQLSQYAREFSYAVNVDRRDLALEMFPSPDKQLLDMLHGEMVASMEAVLLSVIAANKEASGNFGAWAKKFFLGETFAGGDGKDTALEKYVELFESAGNNFSDLLKEIESKKKLYQSIPETVQWLDTLKSRLVDRFVDMGTKIEDAVLQIGALPPQEQEFAAEDMQVLMCILPPSKYKHIPDYMRARSKRFGLAGV